MEVRRNDARSRYELRDEGELVGIADYTIEGDTAVFPHTEITAALRGRGLGDRLVRDALDDVRRRGLKVVPLCWFVRDFIRDNPDYSDLAKAG
jgi:predicted GNAT family acetyltransferase